MLIQLDSSNLENTTPSDINNQVSGPVGMGYYEGDFSRPLVVPDNEHGRASLLETVGHFHGGTDVVRAMN
ncbi:hypothetical protein SAY87_015074 [Trapa incisa]|uniref:Uncharacterized protein n=1 Tax=Trapa incisa TaxID=236973 RepID=A0AAN7GWK9_9MYRT|nr:hypothetical protein SAY87_015074 [Trapa incisa]